MGKHVTDSDLQPAASSSSLRQHSAALSQPLHPKDFLKNLTKEGKKD